MTWDCSYKIKSVSPGMPVSFSVNYTCLGDCGPVLSFGLQDPGFTPAGASGHLVGGRRLPGGLELTFAFDSVKESGASGNGHAEANRPHHQRPPNRAGRCLLDLVGKNANGRLTPRRHESKHNSKRHEQPCLLQ